MATIKRTPGGSIITKGGLPSCSCCNEGICSGFDLDMLLFNFPPEGYVFTPIDAGFVEGLPTLTGYKRKDACLRFLCREVVVAGGVIVSENSTEFGGPTTNGKDLWLDICRPLFGDETLTGNYFYVIEFEGWIEDGPRPRDWISADDQYYVTKYLVTKI